MPKTDDAYWDCECLERYIHKKVPKVTSHCSICGVSEEDMPDSRVKEIGVEGRMYVEPPVSETITELGTPAPTNVLEGMRCPFCGQHDSLQIVGTARFFVTDDGTSEFENADWADEDNCYCPACGCSAQVKDFKKPAEPPKEQEWEMQVTRKGYGVRSIKVKAFDLKGAEEAALEEAGNHTYSEHHADYEIEGGDLVG